MSKYKKWLIDQQEFQLVQNIIKFLYFHLNLLFFPASGSWHNWEGYDLSWTDLKVLDLILADDPLSVSIP